MFAILQVFLILKVCDLNASSKAQHAFLSIFQQSAKCVNFHRNKLAVRHHFCHNVTGLDFNQQPGNQVIYEFWISQEILWNYSILHHLLPDTQQFGAKYSMSTTTTTDITLC